MLSLLVQTELSSAVLYSIKHKSMSHKSFDQTPACIVEPFTSQLSVDATNGYHSFDSDESMRKHSDLSVEWYVVHIAVGCRPNIRRRQSHHLPRKEAEHHPAGQLCQFRQVRQRLSTRLEARDQPGVD